MRLTRFCWYLPILLFFIIFSSTATGKQLNGFRLDNALIPVGEILRGGPEKDGIPALDYPRFIQSDKKTKLQDDDYVMGVVIKGIARAYPIRIMNWHEIVNDSIAGKDIVVTYCPLCGSGMVFNANIDGQKLTFGVSGLLYNSDVLLYDRKTQSLWSQLESKAVTGRYKGKKLESLAVQHTTWADWRRQYPNSQILSFNTGYSRNYSRNPYANYAKTEQLFFPVKFRAHGIHPKEKVIAIVIDGIAKAWPFVELRRSNGKLQDKIGQHNITVEYNSSSDSARILDNNGRLLPGTTLFWFAWAAFHPDTKIFKKKNQSN